MAFIGYLVDGIRHIGRVEGAQVVPYGPVNEFYRDPWSASRVGEPIHRSGLTEVPFVPETARVFCVGINYHAHADEAGELAGLDLPEFPMVFGRWQQSLVTDGESVPLPPNEPGLDWEVELAVIIGRETWAATEDTALDGVFGYTAFNDLSARSKQMETTQFTLGKNADRSGPIGPVLKTAAEIGDPTELQVTTRVNGEIMQKANTRDLIHGIPQIISYITDTVTLLPGDVIATGTPGGVGAALNPPRFLRDGDVVQVEVENIGTLTNPIVARGAGR